MEWIEAGIEEPLNIVIGNYEDERSPFNTAHDQYLISDKIDNEGFELSRLEEWMKPLIIDF